MPRALSDTMGDQVYLARKLDEAQMNAFLRYAWSCRPMSREYVKRAPALQRRWSS